MNYLRSLMLIGSLGRVWARKRMMRNIFSSISIVAYFKLLDNYESGVNSDITIIPNEHVPYEATVEQPANRVVSVGRKKERRQRLAQTMRNVNRAIYGN